MSNRLEAAQTSPVRTPVLQTPAERVWRPSELDCLEEADLGLSKGSDGRLVARQVRSKAGAKCDGKWRSRDAQFDFIYVLKGRVTIEHENLGPVTLEEGATLLRPRGMKFRELDHSRDYEGMEIFSTRLFPQDVTFSSAFTKPVVTHDGPHAYVVGEGERSFFKYRDLGLAALTNQHCHIHITRALSRKEGGTGWHYHSMGQFAFGLSGWATLDVDNGKSIKVEYGTALSVPPQCSHDVPAYSEDYAVFELWLPAHCETVTVAAPASKAAGAI